MTTATRAEGRKFSPTLKDARMGDTESQYQVGLMLANGIGVKRDAAQGLEWITRAAERGHAGAQFLLGSHYAADGVSVMGSQHDELRAMEWLFKAAQQGHPRAHHRLAVLLRQSHLQLARGHEEAAARLGVADAQLLVGLQALDAATPQAKTSAMAWLQRAAEQGLPAAQTALGKAYVTGQGVPVNAELGLQWLRKATAKAWPPAMVYLEFLEGAAQPTSPARNTPSNKRPTSAAVSGPPPAAARVDPGDSEARYHLGLMHELGIGIPVDTWQARHWYGLAATQGHTAAHTGLGRLLVESDLAAACTAWRFAADAGDRDAQFALSRWLSGSGRSALDQLESQRWLTAAAHAGQPEALLTWSTQVRASQPELAADALRRAAEAGLAQAQFQHAEELSKRLDGPAQREAIAWYRRAAEQGHATAQCAIGVAYRQGRGVERDEQQAREWLERAAAQGDGRALWQQALLLAAGAGDQVAVLLDALQRCEQAAAGRFLPAQATLGLLCARLNRHAEALRWWEQAAQHGDVEALYNLGLALADGRSGKADASGAFLRFLQAAEQDLVPAQARVGLMYATGEGVAADPIEAHKWFALAKAAGDKVSAQNLQRSREQLSPAALAEAERRVLAWRAQRRA